MTFTYWGKSLIRNDNEGQTIFSVSATSESFLKFSLLISKKSGFKINRLTATSGIFFNFVE